MWDRIVSRIRAFVRRRNLDDELQVELRFHVEMAAEANRRAGMTPEEARDKALRDFGGVLQQAEAVRDHRWLFVDEIAQDVRYAVRAFRRAPAFSLAVLLTFAVGIGVTTATYSVVYSLLFRPLPLPDADRIVSIMWRDQRNGALAMGLEQDAFSALHSTEAFESVAAWDYLGNQLGLVSGTRMEPVEAAEVSAGFFSVVGVQPALGRAFRDEECRPGANEVVVLSYEYWQRRFAGDPGIVGRRLPFKGGDRTVIGVMPAGFWCPRLLPNKDPEAYYPSIFSWDKPLAPNAVHFLIARVRRGVSLTSAQAAADVVASRLPRVPGQAAHGLAVLPFREQMGHSLRRLLLLLQAAVLILLLAATANVANLMLAHVRGRRIELAIRSTLGASRFRVIRQMATESVTLAVAGGGLGIAVAWWAVSAAKAILPPQLRFAPAIAMDVHVLGVGLALSVGAGGLVAFIAAVTATSRTPWARLVQATRPRRPARLVGFLQSGLVIAQVVLAVVLLAATGLVLHSITRLHASSLGFGYPLDRFAAVDVDPPAADRWTRADWARLVDGGHRVAERVSGVEAVFSLAPPPLSSEMFGSLVLATDEGAARCDVRFVGPGALEALGLRALSGRLLQASDGKPQPDAAVVTEGFAGRFLRGRDPVGQVLNVRLNGKPTIRTIVGVVPNVRDRALIGELEPVMFTLFDAGSFERRRSFLLRTAADAEDVAQAVSTSLQRAGIAARVRPLVDTRDRQFATARFCTLVITAFGGIALVLVLVGMAGVVGEAVVRRTREIGVRIAVGARPAQVVRLVLRQVAVPSAVGVCMGIVGAAWFTRGLRAVLFEVEPNDPLTFLFVLAVVGGSALVAAWLPARRAARIDPVEALKVE